MEKDIKKIPLLIFKHIVESISEGERKELDEWTKAKKSNKELLERLSRPDFINREMQRRRAVNTQRPLDDMKARIAREFNAGQRRHRRNIIITVTTAAATVLLFIGISQLLTGGGRNYIATNDAVMAKAKTISHGKTQAMLTLDNGRTIELGADSAKNVEVFAEVEKEGETKIMNLSTPRGGEFKVTLEDGTEVWLNAQSQLRYPETFEGNERRVELNGEAYFKVAKDTEKPFIVESAGQTVRVTGTEFNINSYDEDTYIYTTLVSGGIALKPRNGNGGELVLTPGHQAVFDKDDEQASVRHVDTGVVTSWRTGSFVFEDQTLEQIMLTLSRWYDFDYEFKDAQVKKIVFMGSVPRYGEFNDVIRILEMSGNIKFELKGKKLIVKASA